VTLQPGVRTAVVAAAALLLAGAAGAGHFGEAPGPQVDIETRFLSVDDDFLRDIGVDFDLPGSLPWLGDPEPTARVPVLGKLPVLGRLLGADDAGSAPGTELLAAPRLVTLAGQRAQIRAGGALPAESGLGTDAAPFGIRLSVLPHVLPDGRVVMTLDIDVDRVRVGPGAPTVHSRPVETAVLVRDASPSRRDAARAATRSQGRQAPKLDTGLQHPGGTQRPPQSVPGNDPRPRY